MNLIRPDSGNNWKIIAEEYFSFNSIRMFCRKTVKMLKGKLFAYNKKKWYTKNSIKLLSFN